MKKKFLFAALSLMISISCVNAQCPNAVKPESAMTPPCAVKQEPCPAVPENPACKCRCAKECNMDVHQSALRYQKYIARIERNRAAVYNALNLTQEQIKTREDLIRENNPIYDCKFEELIKESSRLKALKLAGASQRELNRQKRVVKCIKNNIDDLLDKENNAFKKCLTKEQRSKYTMIKKLERDDYKKSFKHKQDYYKSNPQMHFFGNPKACPCTYPKDVK